MTRAFITVTAATLAAFFVVIMVRLLYTAGPFAQLDSVLAR